MQSTFGSRVFLQGGSGVEEGSLDGLESKVFIFKLNGTTSSLNVRQNNF